MEIGGVWWLVFFFFSSRRRHTRLQGDWSSDVCSSDLADTQVLRSASYGATVPPWSAAHPYTNLHGPRSPVTATVVGNLNCTEAGFDSETHHIVLDFGSQRCIWPATRPPSSAAPASRWTERAASRHRSRTAGLRSAWT